MMATTQFPSSGIARVLARTASFRLPARAAACVALAALAAAPVLGQDGDKSAGTASDTTRPSREQGGDRGSRGDRGPRGMGGGGMGGGMTGMSGQERFGEFARRNRNVDPPTDDEWKEISAFMSENLPNRWQAFEEKLGEPEMPGREDRRAMFVDNMKKSIAGRYRMYKRMETDAPALYAVVLDQSKAEDQVWGAWRDYRKNLDKNPDDKTSQVNLRAKVAQLVKANLAERKQRVEQLRAALVREEKNLSDDTNRTDDMVETQFQRWTSEDFPGFPDGMNGRGPGGPGGPGHGPGGGPGDGPPPGPPPGGGPGDGNPPPPR